MALLEWRHNPGQNPVPGRNATWPIRGQILVNQKRGRWLEGPGSGHQAPESEAAAVT